MKIAILIDHLILGGAQIIALNEAHELIKLGHKVDVLVLVKNPALKREVSSKEKDSSFISRWTSGVFCLFPIKSSPNEKLKENLKEFTRGLNIKYLAENYPIPFRKAILVPPSRFFTTAHLFSPYLAPRVISKQQYDLLIAHGSTTCPTARAIRRRKDIPYIAYINDSVHYIFNKVYKPQITRTKKWISLRKKAQANLPSEFTLSSNKMNISEDLIKRIERSYLNNALVVAALSKHTQNDIRSTYGIKTTVITPGCTPLLQIPTRRGDFLLASSRWSSTKNPEFLLQILQQIPNVQLKIAGGWENQTDLHKFRKEIQKQQLTSRVELITSLNERQKTKLFQRARAWVHPHFEAFGMDALAAASCGCPVIMPYGSGAAQLFEHGQHGFFPPENDLNAFTKYIKELIEDERLAHKLGQKAWKITKDNYTWEKHTEKILENASLKASRYRKAPQCSGDALASRQRDKSPPENASLKASRYRKAPQSSGDALASRQIPFIALETGHVSSTAVSGGDILFKRLYKFLPPNFDIQVIIPHLALPHWQNHANNLKLHILPNDPLSESQNRATIFLNYLWRIYHSFRAIGKAECERPGIVYSSTNVFPDIIPAHFYKKHYPQTKWIARVHHLTPPPHQRKGSIIIKALIYPIQRLALKLIKNADLILVLNKTLKRELIEQGFAEEKIKVSGGGIDFAEIQKYQPYSSVKRGTTRLPARQEAPPLQTDSLLSALPEYHGVFLGRLHPSKGVFDLPYIWMVVIRQIPSAKLAIIGETTPDTTQKLKKLFRQQGISSQNYQILGYLPRDKVLNALKSSKVFLFCDHEAGWGIAIAEAMACGLPVVSYNLPIFGDVFQKGFVTVPVFDTKELGRQIVNLLSSSELHQKLSKEALEQAKELDWEMAGREFRTLIEEITNEGKISNI